MELTIIQLQRFSSFFIANGWMVLQNIHAITSVIPRVCVVLLHAIPFLFNRMDGQCNAMFWFILNRRHTTSHLHDIKLMDCYSVYSQRSWPSVHYNTLVDLNQALQLVGSLSMKYTWSRMKFIAPELYSMTCNSLPWILNRIDGLQCIGSSDSNRPLQNVGSLSMKYTRSIARVKT